MGSLAPGETGVADLEYVQTASPIDVWGNVARVLEGTFPKFRGVVSNVNAGPVHVAPTTLQPIILFDPMCKQELEVCYSCTGTSCLPVDHPSTI